MLAGIPDWAEPHQIQELFEPDFIKYVVKNNSYCQYEWPFDDSSQNNTLMAVCQWTHSKYSKENTPIIISIIIYNSNRNYSNLISKLSTTTPI
jgi:hypothetical protein